ncbi:uncharacterized protein PG998_011339 [Apiospora kogelbergensis]|uniref:Uncharacterized protein n=1 Tax=Apiospora kogelbergensis TaxID=1337665 RepID=A0AAW0RC97_9PEZI
MRSFNITLSFLLGTAFTGLCFAEDAGAKPTKPLPASCTTTSRHAAITHSCYTATAYTTPRAGCERLECPPPKKPVVCPQIIIESTVEVPCKTDCCPTTATITSTTACPVPCPKCPIPTHVTTITTGCPK